MSGTVKELVFPGEVNAGGLRLKRQRDDNP